MIPQQLLGEVKEFEGRRGLRGTVVRAEDEMVYVVFADYPIRSARYNRDRTSVMITNTVHYPKTPFDMFFTPCDTLLKGDGRPEGAFTVVHMGKEWLSGASTRTPTADGIPPGTTWPVSWNTWTGGSRTVTERAAF